MNTCQKVCTFIVFLTLLILTACNDTEEDLYEETYHPVLEEGTTKLTLRDEFYPMVSDGSNENGLREMYDDIEEKTGLSIISDSKSIDGYRAILKDELSRGELPDIIQLNLEYDDGSGNGISFLREEKENLLDLTDFLEESGLMDKFYMLDSYMVDGRVYGLPIYGSTMHLYYNKELVEELGGVPETLEEFISIMKEAKQAGYNPIAINEMQEFDFSDIPYKLFQGILLETAGKEKLYKLMNGEVDWTDDEFVPAFQLMEEIAQLEVPRLDMFSDELYNEFLSGNIVFMYFNFEPNSDKFGVMRLPTGSSSEENSSSIIANFPVGYVFNGDVSEEKEQMIYQFIETLWSEAFMTEYYAEEYIIPGIQVDANTDHALFNEVVQLTNETTTLSPEMTSMLPDTKGGNFYQSNYELRTIDVIKDLANGDLSMQEAVEKMNTIQEDLWNSAQTK